MSPDPDDVQSVEQTIHTASYYTSRSSATVAVQTGLAVEEVIYKILLIVMYWCASTNRTVELVYQATESHNALEPVLEITDELVVIERETNPRYSILCGRGEK